MAKPELGTKRVCVSCGAKFYDLMKTPAVNNRAPAPPAPGRYVAQRTVAPWPPRSAPHTCNATGSTTASVPCPPYAPANRQSALLAAS